MTIPMRGEEGRNSIPTALPRLSASVFAPSCRASHFVVSRPDPLILLVSSLVSVKLLHWFLGLTVESTGLHPSPSRRCFHSQPLCGHPAQRRLWVSLLLPFRFLPRRRKGRPGRGTQQQQQEEEQEQAEEPNTRPKHTKKTDTKEKEENAEKEEGRTMAED